MKIFRLINRPANFILLGIIGFDLLIRIWDVTHLYKWIYDYDEGAYSLGGRFIAQGYLPYQDFTLVHPPLHDLTLAGIYKILGYNFIYGRYFSVIISVICIILAYLIVKKLYNSSAGLIAAAFFALFPGFSLFWYRVVQEPLGILFILSGIFFATDYILKREFGWRILVSGICLGLALTVKYTFIPAVAGCVLAFAVISLQGRWKTITGWFNRDLWLLVGGTALGFLTVTGYFLFTMPQEYISQTLTSQMGYRLGNISLSSVARVLSFSQINWETGVTTFCIYFTGLACIAMAAFRRFSNASIFILIGLVTSFVMSVFINRFGELRYLVSAFIFVPLAAASFVPKLNMKLISGKLTAVKLIYSGGLIVNLILLLVCAGGIVILLRYDYNYMGSEGITYEENVYKQTVSYLESVGAKKVYSLNPIIPALSPKINSSLNFDSFGYIEVLGQSPADIVQRNLREGVDYIVIDAVPRLLSLQRKTFGELYLTASQAGELSATFVPGELKLFEIEIYAVPNFTAGK
jgi:4-amino-4-deoxy-L-arabinose transferase-like glycosyltransferase